VYYRTEGPGGRRHFGRFGTHFRLVLICAITSYGAWFWTAGIGSLPSCDRREACGGLRTFFFAPGHLGWNGQRVVNIIIAFGAAVYYNIMGITAGLAAVVFVWRKWHGKPARWQLIGKPSREIAMDRRE
jgi:hypothetical protein